MNDVMTKSFSYVQLKKQVMKDIAAEEACDLEIAQVDPSDHEQNLSNFFKDVTLIKNDMEDIANLLIDLQDLKQEVNTTHSAKVVRDIRERISSYYMVRILRNARNIKSRLESLDESNIENHNVSIEYKEGTHVDRTRVSMTNGLRVKLREMMIDFQSLRQQIVEDHKEELKKRHYNVTGEEPSEEMIEKMMVIGSDGGQVEKVFEGKANLVMENSERQEALKEMQRSLTELHHLFFNMAVLVETQGEDMINDIENNVAQGGITHVNVGTNGLFYVNQMKKLRWNWGYWIGGLVLVLLLVWIICILSS